MFGDALKAIGSLTATCQPRLSMRVLSRSVATVLALAGCANQPSGSIRPEPLPLGRELQTGAIPSHLAAREDHPRTRSDVSNPATMGTGLLTLKQALALALTGNPDLAVFSYDKRSAEARTLQAGFRPNPEIRLEAEDFGGTKGYSGFQQSQATLALSQVVELGGKRTSRLQLAHTEEVLAAWDYEAKRLDVFVEVTKAFVAVLTAQRKVELAEATLRIEQQFHSTVGNRVREGQVSPIEQRRADVTLANGRVASDKAKRDLSIARDRLAATWGERQARFARVVGNLNSVAPPLPLDRLLAFAAQNPDLARWSAEIQQREARLAVERTKNVPDLSINGGVRKYGDGGSAFVAGVGIQVPVFGLNRGNILDAQVQLNKGHAQQRAAEIRIETAVRQSHEQLAGAFDELTTLRRSAVPAAEATFKGVSVGYSEGKFGLIEVIDARRALTDTQSRLLDALSAYHAALAEAERLTGQPLRGEDATNRTEAQR